MSASRRDGSSRESPGSAALPEARRTGKVEQNLPLC